MNCTAAAVTALGRNARLTTEGTVEGTGCRALGYGTTGTTGTTGTVELGSLQLGQSKDDVLLGWLVDVGWMV